MIIRELGGASEVAAVLGIRQSAVSNWCSEGIPLGRLSQLAALAKYAGKSDTITLDVLRGTVPETPERIAAEAA